LLLLFVGKRKELSKTVIDIHEKLDRDVSFLENLLIRRLKTNNFKSCTTACEGQFLLHRIFKNVYVMDNRPLIEDFITDRTNETKEKRKAIYVGMVTEENRQMLKTLRCFSILMQSGKFKCSVIGAVANRKKKTEIESEIHRLSIQHPLDFEYVGATCHEKAVVEMRKSDFGFNLISLPNTQQISPNKNFEYIASKTVLVTDHDNFPLLLPSNLYIKVDKQQTAEEIAEIVMNTNENQIKALTNQAFDFLLEKGYLWERYTNVYDTIFERDLRRGE